MHLYDFLKLLIVLKKVGANKLLNGTSKVLGDIDCHHTEQINSYSLVCFDSLMVFIIVLLQTIRTQNFS